jgi:ArsR family transcriptional regulator
MPKKSLKPRDLSEEAIELIAARFKVLSEPPRLKLLIALEGGECNVTGLVELTGLTQVNVSRHLATLAAAGLVSRRKAGTSVYYRIADEAVFTLCEHVCMGLERRLSEKKPTPQLFRAA